MAKKQLSAIVVRIDATFSHCRKVTRFGIFSMGDTRLLLSRMGLFLVLCSWCWGFCVDEPKLITPMGNFTGRRVFPLFGPYSSLKT